MDFDAAFADLDKTAAKLTGSINMSSKLRSRAIGIGGSVVGLGSLFVSGGLGVGMAGLSGATAGGLFGHQYGLGRYGKLGAIGFGAASHIVGRSFTRYLFGADSKQIQSNRGYNHFKAMRR